MKNFLKYFPEIAAALFIFLFVYTGYSKLSEHHKFIVVLSRSPLLAPFSFFLSWLIPITELIIAALLFFRRTRKSGFLLSLFLMTIFTFYIGYMLLFAANLPCSCGGVLKNMSWTQHLIFNIFFTALAAFNLLLLKQTKIFIAINRQSRTPVKDSRQL